MGIKIFIEQLTQKGEQFYNSLVAQGKYNPGDKKEGEEWHQIKDSQGTKTPQSKDNIIKIKTYFDSNDIPSNWVEAYDVIDSVPRSKNDIIQKLEDIISAPNVDNGQNEKLIKNLKETLSNISKQ